MQNLDWILILTSQLSPMTRQSTALTTVYFRKQQLGWSRNSLVIDYTHLVCLGVARNIATLRHTGRSSGRLTETVVSEIHYNTKI